MSFFDMPSAVRRAACGVRRATWSWLGALRDSELVPEHQDLDVFRRTRPGKQRKPSEELTRELIDQTYRHDPA